MGDVPREANQASMAARSYEKPSRSMTGSVMTVFVMGPRKDSGMAVAIYFEGISSPS